MVMKLHGNVRGEVRVNFLALCAWKPHIFMCGALKLSGIVRANVRLIIAIPMLFVPKLKSSKEKGEMLKTKGKPIIVAPYRAILRCYRCDTPYREILFQGV